MRLIAKFETAEASKRKHAVAFPEESYPSWEALSEDEDEDDDEEDEADGAMDFIWWSSCVCLRRVKRPRKRGRSVWK